MWNLYFFMYWFVVPYVRFMVMCLIVWSTVSYKFFHLRMEAASFHSAVLTLSTRVIPKVRSPSFLEIERNIYFQ